MTFHVGQKVVCVNPWHTDSLGKQELIENAIYTIRWIGDWEYLPFSARSLCLRLYEVHRGQDEWCSAPQAFDIPFCVSRFRPLTERPNDGEAFVRKLKDACQSGKVDA